MENRNRKTTDPLAPIPNPSEPVVLDYRKDEWQILKEALFREGARLLYIDRDEQRSFVAMDMLERMAVAHYIQSRSWPETVKAN